MSMKFKEAVEVGDGQRGGFSQALAVHIGGNRSPTQSKQVF